MLIGVFAAPGPVWADWEDNPDKECCESDQSQGPGGGGGGTDDSNGDSQDEDGTSGDESEDTDDPIAFPSGAYKEKRLDLHIQRGDINLNP